MDKPQILINYVEKMCYWGSVASILIMMFLTTFDLIARKIGDYSIPSLYEFTEDYLMVALVFLSMSYVYRIGGHVRVTLFEGYIPFFLKRRLDKILNLFTVVFFAFITLKGFEVTIRAFRFQEVSSSLLAYPLGPALFFVPLGSALMCIRIMQSFFSVSGPDVESQ